MNLRQPIQTQRIQHPVSEWRRLRVARLLHMAWTREIFHRSRAPSTPPPAETTAATIRGDNPIQRPEDDTLNRNSAAEGFARHVLALDASNGVVVGVLGPWGYGKTSFVNLARLHFEHAAVPVLDFNPWMFSGAEQLVESFFVELSAQLKVRPGLVQIGKDFEDYGEAFSGLSWLPLVGPWIERGRMATKILGKLLQRRKEGTGGRRAKLQAALRQLNAPLIVLLDDIDRLSTSEIRHIFKLVRLTASFPNIIYVLAFDRARVENALGEQGVPGRDYLEKILQLAIDLPAVPTEVLTQQIFAELDAAIKAVDDTLTVDEQTWPDIFMEIIRPVIRNMRDVRRYATAVRGTVDTLKGHVALADILALEAVRIFLPDVFATLPVAVDALTTPYDRYGGTNNPQYKSRVEGLISAAKAHHEVVRAMIQHLFPAARQHISNWHVGSDSMSRWLKERRVAHADLLHFYVERVAGNTLQAFTDSERAFACMTTFQDFDRFLRSIDPNRLQDVIAALENFEDQFESKHVIPGLVVLLNIFPVVPPRPLTMFQLDTHLTVSRVALRLLRSLKGPAAIDAATRSVLPDLASLRAKMDLLMIVGYREGAGHKLIPEQSATALEKAWRDEVRGATAERLATETHLFLILLTVKRDSSTDEPKISIPHAPALTLAILRSAKSEAVSQSMGSRAVQRRPRLPWDALIELYDDEETLRQRTRDLRTAGVGDAEDVLALAERYVEGWRPSDFGDD